MHTYTIPQKGLIIYVFIMYFSSLHNLQDIDPGLTLCLLNPVVLEGIQNPAVILDIL
jgi:hypothetical protein